VSTIDQTHGFQDRPETEGFGGPDHSPESRSRPTSAPAWIVILGSQMTTGPTSLAVRRREGRRRVGHGSSDDQWLDLKFETPLKIFSLGGIAQLGQAASPHAKFPL
jgi:hypothetical protein